MCVSHKIGAAVNRFGDDVLCLSSGPPLARFENFGQKLRICCLREWVAITLKTQNSQNLAR